MCIPTRFEATQPSSAVRDGYNGTGGPAYVVHLLSKALPSRVASSQEGGVIRGTVYWSGQPQEGVRDGTAVGSMQGFEYLWQVCLRSSTIGEIEEGVPQ